jgi:hypothetical protein
MASFLLGFGRPKAISAEWPEKHRGLVDTRRNTTKINQMVVRRTVLKAVTDL